MGRREIHCARARRDPGERSDRRLLPSAAPCLSAGGRLEEMIGRRAFLSGCGALVLLADVRAPAQQPRLGPYTGEALEAVRGEYEPYLQGLFRQDLVAR